MKIPPEPFGTVHSPAGAFCSALTGTTLALIRLNPRIVNKVRGPSMRIRDEMATGSLADTELFRVDPRMYNPNHSSA